MNQIFITSLRMLAVPVFLMASSHVLAEPEVANAKTLALRIIMQEMGMNAQKISDGLAREDWILIEKSAVLIADHPMPPFYEKLRILNFVGTNMALYKDYNNKSNDAAAEVAKAARDHQGEGVIFAMQKLQSSCLDCHQAFRKDFVEYFYIKGQLK